MCGDVCVWVGDIFHRAINRRAINGDCLTVNEMHCFNEHRFLVVVYPQCFVFDSLPFKANVHCS